MLKLSRNLLIYSLVTYTYGN